MPDDKQQTDSTEQEGEQTETTTETTTEGEVEESGTEKLLKALKTEREARQAAERKLKETDKDKRKAETERAIKAGEIETVVASHAAEVADLNQQIADLQAQLTERDTAIIRSKVAAKHRIPAPLVDRIRGTTEQEMDADAKEMAKLIAAPTAPETEAGRGNGRGSGRDITKEHERAADESRIYTPY